MKKKTRAKKTSTNKMLYEINNHPLFTVLFFMIAAVIIAGSLMILIPHF